jgi:hypothetical protein
MFRSSMCFMHQNRLPRSAMILTLLCVSCGTAVTPPGANVNPDPCGGRVGISVSPSPLALGTSTRGFLNVKSTGTCPLVIVGAEVSGSPSFVLPVAGLLTTNCDGTPRATANLSLIAPGTCARIEVDSHGVDESQGSSKVIISSNDPTTTVLYAPVTAG